MNARRKVRFGIIGLGLMGREFGSAIARWCHLLFDGPVPELVGICDTNEKSQGWFRDNFPTIEIATTRYEDLLASKTIDAVYCAVPHNLHEKLYTDIIRAGKHLMGEKPFGIDRKANAAVMKVVAENPKVFVRCCSEFPYLPASQRIISWIREGRFGRIMEVRAGFHHSSTAAWGIWAFTRSTSRSAWAGSLELCTPPCRRSSPRGRTGRAAWPPV
jgi:predicted dehydrogenase